MAAEPTSGGTRIRQRDVVAISIGWVALAAMLLLARQRGAPALDTIWAEDGTIFLTDALNEPFLSALTDPYMGYVHAVPRVLAGLATLIPTRWAASVLALGPALLVAGLSLFVSFAAAGYLRTRWAPGALAAAVILIPAASFEALNNAANLQWFLLFGSFWTVLHQPRSRMMLVAECLFLAVSSATAPLTALFVPIAVGRALGRDRSNALPKLAVLLAGLALQATVIIVGEGAQSWASSHVQDLPGLFGLRVVAHLVTGDALIGEAWRALGWWLGYGALALFVAFLSWGIVRLSHERRRVFWEAAGSAALLFALPALVRGTEHLAPGDLYNFAGSRYAVAPMLLLVTMVVIALDAPARAGRSRKVLLGGALALGLMLAASGFTVSNLRSLGPRWSDDLATAERRCEAGAVRVRIAVAPPDPTMWYVEMSCDRLGALRR
jgi:hypothetical protein